MGMKETERSVRIYFWFAGVINIAYAASTFGNLRPFFELLSLGQETAITFALASQLALGIAYVACGIKVKAALPRGARGIRKVLTGSIALIPINGALLTMAFDMTNNQTIIAAVIGMAIAIYLRANVTRLAAEAAARAGAPAPLPPAKVS